MQKIIQAKWFTILCLLVILVLGGYLRFYGIDWDKNFHLHPDERFLTMVETSLSMTNNLFEYFDTNTSPLNPHNVIDVNGNQTFPFFVYGDFPIILVRAVGELFHQTGYSQIHIVGRYLSGIFDLGTIVLIFFIGKRLFKNRFIGLGAAALYAFAPLPIQISHFFIVDNITTFFGTAAVLCAVNVLNIKKYKDQEIELEHGWGYLIRHWRGIHYYLLFALLLGLAVGSKLNAIALVLMLPSAVLITNLRPKIELTDRNLHLQIRNMILAGLLSFVFFRIFQPYAFNGPGFFNFSINQKWWNNIRELSAISSSLSSYPPSLQWTRRSIFFPLKNMFFWGMGPVLGILSVIGVLLMMIELLRGKKQSHLLVLIWNIAYIGWQAVRWNPTMRYFLLAYPTMALSAAWVMKEFSGILSSRKIPGSAWQIIKSIILVAFLVLSALGGFAFINIYKQPMPRIAASEWIYKHIEGPINLQLSSSGETFIQPIQYPKNFILSGAETLEVSLEAVGEQIVDGVSFDYVRLLDAPTGDVILTVQIINLDTNEIIIDSSTNILGVTQTVSRGDEVIIDFPALTILDNQTTYAVRINSNLQDGQIQLMGSISFLDRTGENALYRRIFELSDSLIANEVYRFNFSPFEDAALTGVSLFRVRMAKNTINNGNIHVSVTNSVSGEIIASGLVEISEAAPIDVRGANAEVIFDNPVFLDDSISYEILVWHDAVDAQIFINGSKVAKETDWDDALPLFMYGMNPFDLYSGVYQSDLNFQMYWDDNSEKYTRISSILDQADYIIMSSNRQWGSLTQAPEKYPLSTHLYAGLLDCGAADVQDCYIQADSGEGVGALGFQLVNTFHSQPEIFGVSLNSQRAEEAFTVYDHPKVLIFKKTEDYAYSNANHYLDQIDLSKVLNISPGELEKIPGLLELDANRQQEQAAAGTWSQLFNTQALINQNQFAAVMIWYLFISMLGWLTYPLTRVVFPGLKNRGWGLNRLFGLLMITFIAWIIGSNGISVTNVILWVVFFIYAGINVILWVVQWDQISHELHTNWKRLIILEVVFLGLFVFFLFIRLGNPDLWHPYKGGEKPMDFSYFNAVIKSEKFPPYDPWYSGGYINYYYWGFLIAAIPTRLLGIIPSIAYNLVLPLFFAFTGVGAFTIGQNLAMNEGKKRPGLYAGLIALVFVLLIGNLGTVEMIMNGFQKLGVLETGVSGNSVIDNISVFLSGIKAYADRGSFNYYPGDWYWIPSRAIPGEPITEFPYFTFLYGDPHAHLFAYPITLLVICWSISTIMHKLKFNKRYEIIISLVAGAMMVGILRPTNTWDYPVFLLIAIFSIIFTFIKYGNFRQELLPKLKEPGKKIAFSISTVVIFVLFTFVLFQSYTKWYGAGYTSIALWEGDKTPIAAYILHWGIFIFITVTWLINEVIQWMKHTPLSRVSEWGEYRALLIFAGVIVFGLLVFLLWQKIYIATFTVPIILTAFTLTFQKEYPDKKRIVLLMIALGYSLTLIVEIIVLTGDIGRMNTVFKFYLQAWTCLALASGYGLFDLLFIKKIGSREKLPSIWMTFLILLLISGMLYPIAASTDKVTDRMAPETHLTIDGMDFMQYATYVDGDTFMDLSQDHALIRWMQESIQGTPTIIEANTSEYRWGSRISIYTGLPGVVGWNWHQRQQRTITPDEWIYSRVNDITEFYSTRDIESAKDLLEKYNVAFVVVGQLEQAIYPAEGLLKFTTNQDGLFEEVYHQDDTALYKVNLEYD